MKNYLPIISDTVFCSLAVNIVLRFVFSLFLNSTLSLILSVTISLILGLMFFKIFKKKSGKNNLKKEEERQLKETLIRLSFMKKSNQLKLFERAFNKLNVKTEIINGRIRLPQFGAVIFLRFDFDCIKKSEFIKFCNLLNGDEIGVIFSADFSSEIKEFSLNFDGKIKLFSGREVYNLLKKASTLPEHEVYFFKEREKKWDFSLLFNKKRAKNYFFFGVIFMLYSFIVPIKIYYVIVGSLFLIFSLTVKLFGREEKNNA